MNKPKVNKKEAQMIIALLEKVITKRNMEQYKRERLENYLKQMKEILKYYEETERE